MVFRLFNVHTIKQVFGQNIEYVDPKFGPVIVNHIKIESLTQQKIRSPSPLFNAKKHQCNYLIISTYIHFLVNNFFQSIEC